MQVENNLAAADPLAKPFELVEIRNGKLILNFELLEEVWDFKV